MVSPAYQQFTNPSELPRIVTAVSARTLVLDIEPLVAAWGGSLEALDRGVGAFLRLVAAIPGVEAVCFATNSARRPDVLPSVPGVNVTYVVSARKPLSVAPYRLLPTPGVVIGDQVLTDGLLARRLGYFFLHYRHPGTAPAGPRTLDAIGQLARPLIFGR